MPSNAQAIVLNTFERRTLEHWGVGSASVRLALRSRIVLKCSEGASNNKIASELDIQVATVRKWRTRFLDKRLEGLRDSERSGRPPLRTNSVQRHSGAASR